MLGTFKFSTLKAEILENERRPRTSLIHLCVLGSCLKVRCLVLGCNEKVVMKVRKCDYGLLLRKLNCWCQC